MRRDSYPRIAAELIGLISVLALVAGFGLRVPKPPEPRMEPTAVVAPPPRKIASPRPKAEPPAPLPIPAPILDSEAVARAEERVKSARDLRGRAEKRLAEVSDRLSLAQKEAVAESESHKVLASSIPDFKPRIDAARQKGEALKAETDRIEQEILALNAAPRPRRKPLVDKSPVATLANAEEFHFEVHNNRVAFIDLERLLERVKADARTQIRLGGGGRKVTGQVGPVGSFSIHYTVGRLDDGSNPRMGNFGLTGWEIIPEHTQRGETFASAIGPASDFSRAIHRLDPSRDVVTLWVYPDSFPLYRQLRDVLRDRGFLIAARPMPDAMPIRGSPSGSASSAQ